MEDWFGDKVDSPAEMRENLPSCYEEWRPFCAFCDAKTVIYFEGKYLCLKHADEIFDEFLEND